MDSLDLPTHQLILDSLALNLADDIANVPSARSKVRSLFANSATTSKATTGSKPFLSASAARTQISLALFASSISSASHSTEHTTDVKNDEHLVPVLDDLEQLLRQLTLLDYDQQISSNTHSLPDQLAFALVSSFLQVSIHAPHHRARCVDAIFDLASKLSDALGATSGDAHTVVVKLAPLFNGLYRAIASTSFGWKLHEFARLADVLTPIVTSTQTVRRLNDALLLLEDQSYFRQQAGRATRRAPKVATVRPTDDQSEASVDTFFSGDEDEDADLIGPDGGFVFTEGTPADEEDCDFRTALLERYRLLDTPLSGHYILLASIDMLEATLAQALAMGARPPINDFSDYQKHGLDLDYIDPSRQSQADRFDLDSDRWELDTEHHHSRAVLAPNATKKAWDSLLRYSIQREFANNSSSSAAAAATNANGHAVQANGGNALPGSLPGGLLAAVPLLGGSGNKSAAFGDAKPTHTAKSTLHDLDETLYTVLRASNRSFHDVQRFLLSEGAKGSEVIADLHGPEILAESLKLLALCSVARSLAASDAKDIDNNVFVRIRSLLSESAPVFDARCQGAALQSVGVLVRNNQALALPMTRVLRHFVTSPLPIFMPSANGASSPILLSAARCLASCVTIAPGDDLVVSTMYNLLNYLGRDTPGGLGVGGVAGSGVSVRSGASRALTARDQFNGVSLSGSQANFSARTEEQRKLINLSTITVISRLALEVGKSDVTALTVSMLLQRLRNADVWAEAAILDNVVPLALAGPRSAYIEVVRALSAVSRNALTGGANRHVAVAVESAQLKLARGLGRLDEKDERDPSATDEDSSSTGGGRKEILLVELLQLFAEKGVQLQTAASSGRSSAEELAELNADLATLLPAIAAVLEHSDLHPEVAPTTEMVSLFRNMWFLSVLFGFVAPATLQQSTPASTPAQAQAQLVNKALSSISLKTPTIVPESAHNYLESDLEYNSVLKREFSHQTLDSQRKALSSVIPSHASEIRTFSYAQVTFLSTIYELECLRSKMGRPSMVLWYFTNQGLNASALVGAMQAIADKVIEFFISDLASQVGRHQLDPRVCAEVVELMLGCCHRVAKVRQVAQGILDKVVYALPSVLCDAFTLEAMLEMLTLLRKGCEDEYRDEFAPRYRYASERAKVVQFDLSDSYAQRNEILASFSAKAREYLSLVVGVAPLEVQGILERYLASFDEDDSHSFGLGEKSELGKSVALEFARSMPISARKERLLPALGGARADKSSGFISALSAKSTYLGEMTGIHLALERGLVELSKDPSSPMSPKSIAECRAQLSALSHSAQQGKPVAFADLRRALYRSAALIVGAEKVDYELVHLVVAVPFAVFTPEAVATACQVWTWVIGARPQVETKVMTELTLGWAASARARKGVFSAKLGAKHPFLRKTEMGAFNRDEVTAEQEQAVRLFTPHLTLLQLLSSRFEAGRYRDASMVLSLVRLVQHCGLAVSAMSTHPLAREDRFTLVNLGLRVIQTCQLEGLVEYHLREAVYKLAFGWFEGAPRWSFGGNRLQVGADMQVLQETLRLVERDTVRAEQHVTSFPPLLSAVRMPGGVSLNDARAAVADKKRLLQLLVESEIARLSVWANPLNTSSRGSDFVGTTTSSMSETSWPAAVESAWKINASIAVQLGVRFQSKSLKATLGRLVRAQPWKVVDNAGALKHLVSSHLSLAKKEGSSLKWLSYWAAVSPVEAIELFQPEYTSHPLLLQYAMRSLMSHPVELTFFYVPQVVQALRTDEYGYVEQFIFETSKISQLFCHQIIWNMKANSYRDDNAEEEDPMKPTLDRMVEKIVGALSGEAQEFYEREFGFFNEVTSISGKLKPYIKKSKAEKKQKIDEEMAKIQVDQGVYLPSNADGVVVDLDRKSGRPLQSHAKAPFMATFKVRREVIKAGEGGEVRKEQVDVWQAAIFKVGDDCRQDVLALQVIAMFKNVYTTVGVDLYLNPYRVTATGPGCGVIDVVPNATSRDEMGRAKINHLLTFFKGKYGGEDCIAFQQARVKFIQSMAAYSVVCHILQIRDRHNGNMMIDGEGHLVHIDFGFLFDIGPGGMRFEPYSFKLSHEMIDVMGGPGSQGFRMFEELVVKAFLSAREYMDEIVETCKLMLGTELPSFPNGMGTIERLKERFKPELNEREAAEHARWLVKDAYGNRRAVLYDKLQEVTNDIPFAR